MTALSGSRQNAIILVVLLFAQLLLMAGSVRGVGGSTLLQSWMIRVSSPAVAGAGFIGGGFRQLGSGIGNLLHAHTRNAALESELQTLRTELQLARTQTIENDRLRRLLGMREDLIPEGIAGRVVTSVLDRNSAMIVVDRGTAHGVRVDAPVVAWGGAVGRIVAASSGYAKVRLLTDPNSGVAAVVQRNRDQGVVFGKGDRRLDLVYAPRFHQVAHGDRVVTSGLDGIFPLGFGIGTVTGFTSEPDGDWVIHLVSVLDFGELEEVLILPPPVDPALNEAAAEGEEP